MLERMKNHNADYSQNVTLPVVDKWGIQRPETTFSIVSHTEPTLPIPTADFTNIFAAA